MFSVEMLIKMELKHQHRVVRQRGLQSGKMNRLMHRSQRSQSRRMHRCPSLARPVLICLDQMSIKAMFSPVAADPPIVMQELKDKLCPSHRLRAATNCQVSLLGCLLKKTLPKVLLTTRRNRRNLKMRVSPSYHNHKLHRRTHFLDFLRDWGNLLLRQVQLVSRLQMQAKKLQ